MNLLMAIVALALIEKAVDAVAGWVWRGIAARDRARRTRYWAAWHATAARKRTPEHSRAQVDSMLRGVP